MGEAGRQTADTGETLAVHQLALQILNPLLLASLRLQAGGAEQAAQRHRAAPSPRCRISSGAGARRSPTGKYEEAQRLALEALEIDAGHLEAKALFKRAETARREPRRGGNRRDR